MTSHEAQALAQILARVPLTQAEALWLNSLIARLVQSPAQEPPTSPESPS